MPIYQNKRRYKKRRNGVKRYSKYAKAAGNTAYMLAQIYNLKKMMNVEYKNIYFKLTNSLTDFSFAFFSLNLVAEGSSSSQRQGQQIKVFQLYMNGTVKIGSGATDTLIRYMIVLDKQCNGAFPATTALLQDITASDALISPINTNNKYRFQVLYNKLARLSPEYPSQQLKYFSRKQYKIRYSGSTNSITEVTSNNLFLLIFSDETGL